MNADLPFLEVSGPDGFVGRHELNKLWVTIGRLPDDNDVALYPDPQRLVTRHAHCVLKRDHGSWLLSDPGSLNRTFVQRGIEIVLVSGWVPLGDRDRILILARVEPGLAPVYWELTFRDLHSAN